MRRVAAIVALMAVAGVFVALTAGAGGTTSGPADYKIEFDNAFGLVDGADVKVAGVHGGKISSLEVDKRTKKALVGVKLEGGAFTGFRTDVFCEARPQSLIGEYFIDCQPGKGAELPRGSKVPVRQTASTIPPDLVNNILRLPYRERLRIILSELGTGVAGREQDLNDAIRRAVPALRQTDRLLAVLARESNTIRDLTANADRVIGALANNRRDVGRFVVEARDTT